jgi:hypothetical protein
LDKKPAYRIGSRLRWTTEINCVKIFDEKNHQILILYYPEAALWDLIGQHYAVDELLLMMAAITNKSKKETEEWYTCVLDEWSGFNLLEQ